MHHRLLPVAVRPPPHAREVDTHPHHQREVVRPPLREWGTGLPRRSPRLPPMRAVEGPTGPHQRGGRLTLQPPPHDDARAPIDRMRGQGLRLRQVPQGGSPG